MTSARGSFPAACAALVVLAAWSCGGGSSPAAPPAPTAVPATPTPDGGGVSASSCPIGKGSVTPACKELSPRLLEAVDAAIDRLVREHPEIVDRADEEGANTGQYRVLEADAYLDGVISNLRTAGLCAERTMDRERIVAKATSDFSEEWDVLSARGFIRRGRRSYVRTCTPPSFPVAPEDVVAVVRVGLFSFECSGGVAVPDYRARPVRMPLGCDAYVTATPWTHDDQKVPEWIHGNEIEWDLREGADVVRVDPDWRFKNPFNKVLRPTGVTGHFTLCATVLGKEGCLGGQTIP